MNTPHLIPHQIERRVFGYALSQTPTVVYDNVRSFVANKSPASLGGNAAQYIENGLVRANAGKPLVNDDDLALSLLSAGIKDVATILYDTFETVPELSVEQANTIATSRETSFAVAKLALREVDALELLLKPDELIQPYAASEDAASVTTHPDLQTDPTFGCPFAGHEGIVRPEPIFVRFSAWAGQLAVIHYFDR